MSFTSVPKGVLFLKDDIPFTQLISVEMEKGVLESLKVIN